MLIKLFSNIHVIKILNNVPHYPTCGSVNIKKISPTERTVSIWLFGLFSKKLIKISNVVITVINGNRVDKRGKII